ncbi:LysR family transcriptional regulator [Thaumasiovibrio subtropicus]|uniref:LysR family transcriptional regulator n=1 Tax=Thaumasiovibrio subtropicus TaxID=1891207 RepID=UPI000B364017|nr:LysR family transcriptional regulator [Thaumasiovibrio subtropicus]
MKTPPLKAVQAFEVVARLNSFSTAAEQLHITQSAVSHQVKLLENYLGEALFVRQGRKLSMTTVGERYYDEISGAMQTIATATQRVRDGEKGAIRLAIYSSLAVKWLVPHLENFRHLHPDIDLSLNMVGDDPDINDSVGDCFITVSPPSRGYVNEKLYVEKFYPVCGRKLWKQIENAPLPDALWQFPLLSAVSAFKVRGKDWEAWCQQGGITLPSNAKIVHFSHMLLSIEAARYDQGIALVNDYQMNEQDREQYLVKIPLHELETGDIFYFTYKRSRARQHEMLALSRWLKQLSE